MKIYKLNAIDSTNDYLKAFSMSSRLENFTVVTTDYQTKGKGLVNNNWYSQKGKNLLFSVLVELEELNITYLAYLNFAISNAIYEVLQNYLPNISIKWPNDIMSDNKKICGILIENSVKNDKILKSIVGVGLNVNEELFPKNLPNATSLKIELNYSIDKDDLLLEIISSIKNQIKLLNNRKFEAVKFTYESVLYSKNKPRIFKTPDDKLFMGMIVGVTSEGKLLVQLEDASTSLFGMKEIIFV